MERKMNINIKPYIIPFLLALFLWLSISALSAIIALDIYPKGAIALYGAFYGALIAQILFLISMFFLNILVQSLKRNTKEKK
jgi:uncharacterized membrane protein